MLNGLPEVELAAPAPLPAPAPSVPDFEPFQGYLSPAPDGLDAHFAWTVPGGTGEGVAICDMEGGWNLRHEDLPPATMLIPPGESLAFDPVDDHGTEVLGTMFSLPNGWGTTGASYGARCFVAPIYLESGFGLFEQILWAAAQLEPGDVILIEVQTVGPYYRGDGSLTGYVPVEWSADIYNAILTAVGNGIQVVECAGNGSQNLDDALYAAGNFGCAPFLRENDSGAILVGAGIPPTAPELGPDRSRSWFSNFGLRLDVQGWGHRVTTTGAGDLYSDEGENRLFTRYFGGTSSAAPLVASAVASIEGIVEARGGAPVSPAIMRALLRETGTPQQDGSRPASQERIGPRPDLRQAIERMNRPVVSSPEVIRAFEGDTVVVPVEAIDLDGDPLQALTAAPLPDGAVFSTSADHLRGVLTWVARAGQAGSYRVAFMAQNEAQASDTSLIEIGRAERGPMITGPGGTLGIEAGPPVRVTLHASDPNGDPIVRFSALNLPRGATFTTDSTNATGALTWRPDYDQAGQYTLSFEAISISGGQEERGRGLTGITIYNNDRGPVLTAPASVAGMEGQPLSFTVSASDPDGDPIATLRAEWLPGGATFVADASNQSGTFSWTPSLGDAGTNQARFVGENARSGSTAVALSIEPGHFTARAYLPAGENEIRLGSGRPWTCVRIEPMDGNVLLFDVNSSKVALVWPAGAGADSISARPRQQADWGDADANGVLDLTVCFSQEDLRRLFAGLSGGPRKVQALLRGTYWESRSFEGIVELTVVPQRSIREASVTPNPSRTGPALHFYTAASTPASIRVFDVRGRLVGAPLEAPSLDPGFHDVSLSARALPAGIYYYKLETREGNRSGKFLIVR